MPRATVPSAFLTLWVAMWDTTLREYDKLLVCSRLQKQSCFRCLSNHGVSAKVQGRAGSQVNSVRFSSTLIASRTNRSGGSSATSSPSSGNAATHGEHQVAQMSSRTTGRGRPTAIPPRRRVACRSAPGACRPGSVPDAANHVGLGLCKGSRRTSAPSYRQYRSREVLLPSPRRSAPRRVQSGLPRGGYLGRTGAR